MTMRLLGGPAGIRWSIPIAALLALQVPAPATGQAGDPQSGIRDFITYERLGDRVLVARAGVTYFDAVVAVATQEGIVAIDAGSSPTLTREYRGIFEAELGRSDFPFLIQTHSHWDHTNGNRVFPEAEIICHRACTEELAAQFSRLEAQIDGLRERRDGYAAAYAAGDPDSQEGRQNLYSANLMALVAADMSRDPTVLPPTITFNDQLTLTVGETTFEVMFFGKAHTRSDILVYVPEEALLLTGDLFNPGGTGNLSLLNHAEVVKADVERWHSAVEWMTDPQKEIDHILDGHGLSLSVADLSAFGQLVDGLWEGFEAGRDKSARVRLAAALEQSGLEGMEKEYRQILADGLDDYFFYEGEFIDFANHLTTDGRLHEAVAILTINAERNPASWRAFEVLGEASLRAGDREQAIRNFQRSLELNPGNSRVSERLREISGAAGQSLAAGKSLAVRCAASILARLAEEQGTLRDPLRTARLEPVTSCSGGLLPAPTCTSIRRPVTSRDARRTRYLLVGRALSV